MTSVYTLVNADSVSRTLERSNLMIERTGALTANGFPTSRLPDSLKPSSSKALASLSVNDSGTLVGKALAAAETVISGLQTLKANVTTAISQGFLSAMPDQSRLTLQAESDILVGRMDRAVREATIGNANLVQGGGRDVRLATTHLGGAIKAGVQALDSASLGINGLDLTTSAGIKDAKAKVESALNDSKVKYERISALSRAFGYQGSFLSNVQTVLSEAMAGPSSGLRTYTAKATAAYQSAASGRGTLVNLTA